MPGVRPTQSTSPSSPDNESVAPPEGVILLGGWPIPGYRPMLGCPSPSNPSDVATPARDLSDPWKRQGTKAATPPEAIGLGQPVANAASQPGCRPPSASRPFGASSVVPASDAKILPQVVERHPDPIRIPTRMSRSWLARAPSPAHSAETAARSADNALQAGRRAKSHPAVGPAICRPTDWSSGALARPRTHGGPPSSIRRHSRCSGQAPCPLGRNPANPGRTEDRARAPHGTDAVRQARVRCLDGPGLCAGSFDRGPASRRPARGCLRQYFDDPDLGPVRSCFT